jgi:hypothetical protein
LEEAVSVYTARAAEKMRRQNLATANIAIWIETNSFKPTDRQYAASKSVRLPVATADTGKLIAAAIAGLAIIFKPGYGKGFAHDFPDHAKLAELIGRIEPSALSRLHRDFEQGVLEKKNHASGG